MRNKRFNFLFILNIHKDLTDELNLAYVDNEFVSLHDSRYQFFTTCETSDFNQSILLKNLGSISTYHVYCLTSHAVAL